jgi:hypothetical protein
MMARRDAAGTRLLTREAKPYEKPCRFHRVRSEQIQWLPSSCVMYQ